MEVEAKFGIPDELTFQRYLKATALAGFSLDEPCVAVLPNRCLDTADGAFRARGCACRIRRQDSQTLAKLKGLGAVVGAIHHRIEHQVELPRTLLPRDLSQSAACDLALQLCVQKRPLVIVYEGWDVGGRGVASSALPRNWTREGTKYTPLPPHRRRTRPNTTNAASGAGLRPQTRSRSSSLTAVGAAG